MFQYLATKVSAIDVVLFKEEVHCFNAMYIFDAFLVNSFY